jgi:hypothetical protein
MMNCKVIRIEEAAEALGDLVDNCEDWSLILETVFPGMYGTRKVSEKAVMYYTDGSSKRITRYARRAWQGIQVFNPEDQDGSTEAQDAQAKASRHSPVQRTTDTGHTTQQQRPRLLLDLEEATAAMLGARTTVQNVQGQRLAGNSQ